jgi:tripartite-type tricarboxylate transporter receptor subunit TctC
LATLAKSPPWFSHPRYRLTTEHGQHKEHELNNMQRSAGVKALRSLIAMLVLGVVPATSLQAQDFPSRPLKMIVPQPPGGGFDLTGRVIAQRLSEVLGQPVVVENRTGAGTLLGTEAAAKAPADGYTLVVGGFSNIAANVGLYKKLPYDPLVDLQPIGMVSTVGYVLLSRKDLPQTSLRQIIDYARANPGKLTYASGGVGTGQHIAGAVLASLTGTSMLHIPYRGAQPAYQDLLSGRVDLFFDNASTAKGYVDSGQVKAFAISTAARWSGLPQLVTVNETGVATMELEAWFGIFTRAGTPPAVLDRLRSAMTEVMNTPAVASALGRTGNRILKMTPAETEAFVRKEVLTWSAEIRKAGISAE